MKRALVREYLSALDLSVIALHWLAKGWEFAAPGVAQHIRKIADSLAEKARKTRTEVQHWEELNRPPGPDEVTPVTPVPFDVGEFKTELNQWPPGTHPGFVPADAFPPEDEDPPEDDEDDKT